MNGSEERAEVKLSHGTFGSIAGLSAIRMDDKVLGVRVCGCRPAVPSCNPTNLQYGPKMLLLRLGISQQQCQRIANGSYEKYKLAFELAFGFLGISIRGGIL